MLTCDQCKTEIKETERMPTEHHVLCSVDCAELMLENSVQDALKYSRPAYTESSIETTSD